MLLCRAVIFAILSSCLYCEGLLNYSDYAGQDFPVKYLEAEETPATLEDLTVYLQALWKTVTWFHSDLNYTDINKSLGNFFVKCILTRTLLESGDKLPVEYREFMQRLTRLTDDVVTHYVYDMVHGPDRMHPYDEEYRVTMLFKEGENLIQNMEDFKRNRLKKWILNKGKINEFIQEMDAATLPKEKYVHLVDESYMIYYIWIEDSDKCLARIMDNEPPTRAWTSLRPCRNDPHCYKCLHSSPSISYGLSHRLLNVMLYRYLRRCYWKSAEADERHMEVLCAFMYREAVYLARRGYFARDVFMEHVALCGFAGYEELFRKHWFMKAVSWLDGDGCLQESRNFGFNRTRRYMREFPADTDQKKLRNGLRQWLHEECHNHPMSVFITLIAQAVRYTAYKLPVLF